VSVTPGTLAFAVAVAAAVAGADVAGAVVVADPHAVASSATSIGTTCATRDRDRFWVFERCCIKRALLLAFLASRP
jgi:hypothetical protein